MEHHKHLARPVDAESASERRVEHSVRRHHLDLEVVIPGSQRAELLEAARDGPLADLLGGGTGETAAAVDPVEVLRPAAFAVDAPAGALHHDVPELAVVETHEYPSTDSGGNGCKERFDHLRQARAHLRLGEGGADETHPAVDVESDSSRRDDAGVRAKGGDPPMGKP